MIRKFLARLVSPYALLTDVGERWRMQLSMTFSLIMVIGMLGPILGQLFRGTHDSFERNFILYWPVLIGVISYWLAHTPSYKWGPLLLVFGVAPTGFALVLMGVSNNQSAALTTILPLVLVMGSVILSWRGLLFLSLFAGLGTMFLPLLFSDKVISASGMLRDGGIFLVMGALLLSINILRARFEKSRMNELQSANQALQAIQATLEERVNERTALAETARTEAELARRTAVAQVWLMQGQSQLAERMRGEQNAETLANNIISHLCQYLGAQTGALFLVLNERIKLTGRYAYVGHAAQKDEFGFGENLVGEAARERRIIHLTDMDNAPLISSVLGNTVPKQLLVVPFGLDTQVFGVLELATLHVFSAEHITFLRRNTESIAIAFQTAQTRDRIAALLIESQRQAEEFHAQEEELRATNEALQAQSENMRSRR